MKRNKSFILIIAAVSLLLYTTSIAASGEENWQLYDDFNAAEIDTTKWHIDNSSADISIEDDKVKFIHKEGFSSDSSWLSVIDKPETVTGLKATITVESCSGDVKTRIAGNYGSLGSDIAWRSLAIRPNKNRIEGGVSIQSPAPDYEWKYDLFYGNFTPSGSVIGAPLTLSAVHSPLNSRYSVTGVGELDFTFPSKLGPNNKTEIFSAIGTRSNSGIGTCTVYVDDVYILRSQPVVIAPINFLLLK